MTPRPAGANLVINECLYLRATRILGDLEGDASSTFHIPEAMRAYTKDPVVAAECEALAGEQWAVLSPMVMDFVMGVVSPNSYNEELGRYELARDGLSKAAAACVQGAAWSFMTAWTQRYGALHPEIVTRSGVVDPRLREPDRDGASSPNAAV